MVVYATGLVLDKMVTNGKELAIWGAARKRQKFGKYCIYGYLWNRIIGTGIAP